MSISIGSHLQGALRRGAIIVALGAAALVASGVAEAHKAP